MNTDEIIKELNESSICFISTEDLEKFLAEAEILEEKDTLFSGFIRILKLKDNIIVQETNDKQEAVLHLMKDINDAQDLVKKRMDKYEDMWDGCGCKIDYGSK